MFLWRFILKFPYCFFFSGSSRTSRSSWIPWTKRPSSKCHSFSFSFFTDSVFKFCKSQLIYEIYLNTNIDTNSYKNKTCVYMPSHFSCVQLCATLWTAACQAPLSMEFFRQEYWSGLPCPPSGGLPNPRVEPIVPALLHCRRVLYHWATREAHKTKWWLMPEYVFSAYEVYQTFWNII